VHQIEGELGVKFTRVNGRIARLGTVYSAQIPWEALAGLKERPHVARVDSTWKPAVVTPLDMSIPEVRADEVWSLVDASGWALTGRGVVVADFDTGIDVFHPDFWRADGGTYPWLDVNGNDRLDSGVDAVDLNRNSLADGGELLGVINATSVDGIPGTTEAGFQADMDWLYQDANRNGLRDYGPGQYSEATLTYGERLFVVDDSNQNRELDVDEVLLSLATCKVYKTLDADGVERTRGVNLIHNPADAGEQGHGTAACSTLCGGSIDLRRFVGVAPDVTLLVANSELSNLAASILWAEDNGAQVMLYEFGSYVQEFLDGSSNLEQMLDAESAKGIVQVAPAGNLAEGKKHAHAILGALLPKEMPFMVPAERTDAWLSVLWHASEEALSVEGLTTPSGASVSLAGDDSWVHTSDGHHIWSARDRSRAGTSRFDIWVYRDGGELAVGSWGLRLRNNTLSWLNVNAYVADDVRAWEGGITFDDSVSFPFSTVTSPGTANNAITVASYSTRGIGGVAPGALSPFSGRGPRIDNQHVLDVAAPGHYDVACARSKDLPDGALGQYAWFSGTSAAAAHVAGAAALLLQEDPERSPDQVRQTLRDAARRDTDTGVVPNENWGAGKLDIRAAVPATPTITPTPRAKLLLPVVLRLEYSL
jgi:subtilisin family serine protease